MPLIPLYRRGAVVAHTLVDAEDWERFTDSRWRPMTTLGYPARTVDGRTEYLHRLILGLEPGSELEGDHVNRDPLDNRRCNLRAVTHAENMRNIDRSRMGRQRGKLANAAPRAERDRRVLELADVGMGVRGIAADVGLSKSTVHRILAAYV